MASSQLSTLLFTDLNSGWQVALRFLDIKDGRSLANAILKKKDLILFESLPSMKAGKSTNMLENSKVDRAGSLI
jgi:hypothetical protein